MDSTHRASRAVLLLGASLACSTLGGICGPDLGPGPPDPTVTCADGAPPADGQPVVDLSDPATGESLVDGATLPIDYGSQGGSHITVAARLFTASTATWTLEFQILADGVDPSQGPAASGSVAAQACAGWSDATTPVFQNSDVSSGTLRVTATGGGLTLTDEVRVNIQ